MGAAGPSGQLPVLGFRVLGPLEVGAGAGVVALGGPQVRAVLALLLADAGRVVSVAALVEGLWGGQAPPDAEQTVRSYMSRLRRALLSATGGPVDGLLVTRPPGYLLRLDPDALDADRFERLAAAGRWALDDGRPADAAQMLATALGLWRGEAYGEFGNIVALRGEGLRLEQLRLAVTADRIAADLAVGLGEELIGELDALTEANPRHERLWGQLMTALYRAGRQADALEAFVRARRALVAESGVGPSPELAEIHRQLLVHDPSLLAARPAAAPAAGSPDPSRVRPAQLPPAVAGFTGRESELAALDGALQREAARPAAVVISAVSGTAGVGKTALAVHWAHRVTDRFPDGQLYVNLRGFDPGGQAMDPAEAVRGFLAALGVPPRQMPPSLQAQVGLYRTLLAGKRMLVVLDNARDAEQVRPLLPGTPTALAVVTSRSQLTGLVAANAATPLILDIMSAAEARELLARRLGPARVAAEPRAVEEIITRCARLPLALAITAARARQSGFPLAGLVAQLADAGARLDALDAGDPTTQVRAVFSWSHAALTAPAARLFRLLGLCPGADISAAAAASLAGFPPARVRPLLAELVQASLLSEQSPGRYTFHDLLRAYAAELTDQLDTAEDRRRATRRLLDHCLHTAYAAARLLDSHRDPIPVPLSEPALGVQLEHLADQPAALAWLAAEHPVLLAALQHAADSGLDAHAWQLAWTLDTFLTRRGPWQDLADAWQTALPAAGRLGNPAARAHAHRLLARARTLQGGYADAHRHHERALDLFARAGDQVGQAHTHNDLAYLYELEDQPEQALDQDLRALALYQAADHRRGQANALNAVGWYHAQLGDHARALARCREALALHQQLGNRFGEAHTWDSLGYAHHQLAGYAEAADCYQHAADMFRDLCSRYEEATTLGRLGDAHHAAGHPDAARAAWQRALAILTDLDHTDAAAVRTKLIGFAKLAPGA